MLSKNNKISGFKTAELFKTARKKTLPLFDLYYCKNQEFKAGVVISKKLKLNAVERNKLKRRAFSLIKKVAIKKKILGNFLIFINNPKAATVEDSKWLECLKSVF